MRSAPPGAAQGRRGHRRADLRDPLPVRGRWSAPSPSSASERLRRRPARHRRPTSRTDSASSATAADDGRLRLENDRCSAPPRPAAPRSAWSTAAWTSDLPVARAHARPRRRRATACTTWATSAWCRGTLVARRPRADAATVRPRLRAGRRAVRVRPVRASPRSSVQRDGQPACACSSRFGVLGGTVLAFLGGLLVARRAMRPIAGLTRAAREVARTRDPGRALPKPRGQRRGRRPRPHARGHAPRAERRARRDRGGARAPARLRGRRLARAAHAADQHPGQPRAARGRARRASRREMAGSALRSSRRMRRLVADLLLLARADAGREAPRRPVDLVVGRPRGGRRGRRPLAAGHPLALDAPASLCRWRAWPDDLHRLVANLIENALVHTPPGTPVTVSVRARGRRGGARGGGPRARECPPGCASASSSASPAAAATPRGGGSGLGLAIVRAVAEAHGGRVELLDAAGRRGPLRGDAAARRRNRGAGALRFRRYACSAARPEPEPVRSRFP